MRIPRWVGLKKRRWGWLRKKKKVKPHVHVHVRRGGMDTAIDLTFLHPSHSVLYANSSGGRLYIALPFF